MNSRIHRLHTFDTQSATVFVKRDDELSFGISGSKLRKYSSLLPHMLEQKIQQAVLAGGFFSNHILSLSQMLIEKGIKPVLFLSGRKPQKPKGNFIFTSLLVPEEDMHWVPKGEEDSAAEAYAAAKVKQGVKAFYVPTGAKMKESVPGALTLVADIERNEKEAGVVFDHIFIDSGTGTTAASLILGLADRKKTTHVHVVQMASTPERFQLLLNNFKSGFPYLEGPLRYTLYQPTTARSFGSVNASVWRTVQHMARHEGILVDPTYNAKLFAEGKKLLQKNEIQGNVLFIHSGGGLALSGFMEDLGLILQKQVK